MRKIRYGWGNLLVGVLPSLRQKSGVYMYAFEFSPSTSLYPLIAPLFASWIMLSFPIMLFTILLLQLIVEPFRIMLCSISAFLILQSLSVNVKGWMAGVWLRRLSL